MEGKGLHKDIFDGVKEYLKENLRVRVENSGTYLNVTLFLDEEEISTDCDLINVDNRW